jgi:hypothetical protein
VILQCLEKDPGRRPQSADQLSAMLARCCLEPDWTDERAHAWWEMYHPQAEVS